MPAQRVSDNCQNIYNKGDYKSCLRELDKLTGDADHSAVERAAGLLMAGRIERELLNIKGAAAKLKEAVALARESAGPSVDTNASVAIELEASLILNAVRAEIGKNKRLAKTISRESELLLNRVKQLRSGGGSRYDSLYITGLCELGLTKIYADEIALAAQNLRLASGLAEEKFGAESVEMLVPSLYLSIVHSLEEKYSLAMAMARNALQLARANFGKHPLVIQPLYRMAQAASKLQLYSAALDTCRQVEGVLAETVGENNDVYLDILAIKTAAFMSMVEYQSAEKTAIKRLTIAEKLRGKDNPRLINPLCDVAQTLARLGQRDRAEEYFERALTMVSEMARNQGFPEDKKTDDMALDTSTVDSATGNVNEALNEDKLDAEDSASICHLEYSLIEQLSDCYLWQGKLADAALLMPASMRAGHTCKVENVVSIIDTVNRYLVERARRLDLPQ